MAGTPRAGENDDLNAGLRNENEGDKRKQSIERSYCRFVIYTFLVSSLCSCR